ncbi:MAG: hypothetical protein ACJ75F_07435 [Flavisolibacter sp.]|jgi:hypothetical protein
MNLTASIKRLLKIKLVTIVMVTASLAAFAALGDGGRKEASLKDFKANPKSFSLRSNYQFRGNNLFSTKSTKFVTLDNTVVTYQKGNSTYIMPLKKKVLLDKVKFNPSH